MNAARTIYPASNYVDNGLVAQYAQLSDAVL